jgi:DNA-binding transcriptional regulator YhcF (GntR family)
VQLDATSLVPLYQQISDELVTGILTGEYPEASQVPSTTQLAREEQLNPATVLKGMNQLVDAGLLEKRRGVGMFVATGAVAAVKRRRRQEFITVQLQQLIADARALDISEEELVQGIEEGYDNARD